MATLATTHPTLLDVTRASGADGKVQTAIAEILNETNEILDDMVWMEGNLPTGHQTTVRTGIPAPTWRKLYGGVQPTKSSYAKIIDTCGMLEAYAEIDKALADLNGNTAAFRMLESKAHIEGMSQTLADTLIYGDSSVNPERFTGLAPRYNSQSAENADNIITSAATPDSTDNSSIWLIVWGADTVHGIYPKGSKGGLSFQDKGQVTIENIDGSGGRMEAYRSHFRQDVGLCVKDWRYVVRINFDYEDLVATAASGPNLPDLMTQALEIVPSLSKGRPAFYMNRGTRSMLRRQLINKVSNSTLEYDQAAGKRVMVFGEVPVRRCDAILYNESGI